MRLRGQLQLTDQVEDKPRRRRIDRILADDYLGDLADAATDALRAKRQECREEEAVISYARRIVQGKLDVLFAEIQRRRQDGTATAVLDDLPEVLADVERPAAELAEGLRQRAVTTYLDEPDDLRRVGERAAHLEPLGDLEEQDDLTLARRIGKLAVNEERLSELRTRVLACIDTINDEVARRYRDGETDVGELFSTR